MAGFKQPRRWGRACGVHLVASSVRRMTPLRLTGDAERDVDAVDAWLTAPHPGPVVLGRDAVLASVAASAARLGGSGPWVLALPSSYVAGFNVVVRSLVAGHRPGVLGDRGQ